MSAPLAGTAPLIDAHAHFYHAGSGRSDWADLNAARFRAGERIGITYHVASILGTYGFSSPTYFPSPADVTLGNDAMLEIAARERDRVRMYVAVNPNYTDHALREIERCVDNGAIGIYRFDSATGAIAAKFATKDSGYHHIVFHPDQVERGAPA